MIHNLYLLIIPLAGIICIIFIAISIAKPLALRAYLRAVQAAQEDYRKLYIPYVVLPEPDQDTHRLILGPAGAGKTMIMRTYAATAAQNRRAILRGRDKIPLYIPFNKYNLYLKSHQQLIPSDDSEGVNAPDRRIGTESPSQIYRLSGQVNGPAGGSVETRANVSARHGGTSVQPRTPITPAELADGHKLINFLHESDLPGMRHLRRYLKKLIRQGRIIFLCDGLDEIDHHYLDIVSTELVFLLLSTKNRILISCREVEYRTQASLKHLVEDGQLEYTQLQLLQPEQIREYIEHYISQQDNQWQYTAEQLMEIIDRSRLRYLCTNPMLLFTFLEIINSLDIQRGKRIDTRGQLLHEYVSQLIKCERRQAGEAPSESSALAFLAEIASGARWANDRNAIKLHISTVKNKKILAPQSEELTGAVRVWLDKHPPQGPFATDIEHETYDRTVSLQLIQIAQSSRLIDVSAEGVVSFCHELIAAYLVAEYFTSEYSSQQPASLFREELLADAARWSDVVAIWAGLLDDPLLLAERLATWGRNNPAYLLEALSLSFICVGVMWTPPQAAEQQPIVLPSGIVETLEEALQYAEAREKLAHLITDCAEEGAEEIYHALFPLLDVEDIDTLLVLLHETIIPDMLFNQLVAVVDDATYEAQVRRLIQVLGQLGYASAAYAAEWSQPEPGRSVRLRAAMVNILGRTNDQSAIGPLLARLGDPEPFIRGRAINALIRLGPERTVPLLIQTLKEQTQDHNLQQMIHRAVLTILERFLNERDTQGITSEQLQQILEAFISVFTSTYTVETQQLAMEMLVRQANISAGSPTGPMPSVTTSGTLSNPVGTVAPRLIEGREAIAPTAWEREASALDVPPGAQRRVGDHASGGRTAMTSSSVSNLAERVSNPSRPTPIDRPPTNPLPITSSGQTSGNSPQVLDLLVCNLSSENEEIRHSVVRALQVIGHVATSLLLAQLEQEPGEIVRLHIIEIFVGMPELDQRALPYLLHLLADTTPVVQQQAANALYVYAPDSIPGLIELVLFGADEAVATRATQVLGDIGAAVIEPITQALPQVVPGRTRLLVHVLERVRDPRAIPSLIALLQTPDIESLLAIAIIHALCQNPDVRVVPPLLDILTSSNVQVCEEAVNALSYLGEVALPKLIAALDVEEETIATPRVRRALLGMVPFPAEQLIAALASASEAQAEQVVTLLLMKGSDAAQVLATHLNEPDERVQAYVRHTLTSMENQVVIPALLGVLHRPALRPAVEELLLLYLEEAVPQLVGLLGDPERGEAAATILLNIGPAILPALAPGLDNANSTAQERAQYIIADLVRRSPDVLSQVVRLFSTSLPHHAYEALLDVLADELADVSIPSLLEGLENVYLIKGVSDTFVRLVQKQNAHSESALQGLFDALSTEERQRGAKIVLVNIGALAVPGLIDLIDDPDQLLAQAVQEVLRHIGIVAFPAIWAASNDLNNRARREAALSTFRSMPTVEIKDGLIEHLLSDELEGISMALGLLLERIASEATLPRADQEMVRALVEHVQTQRDDHATRRIIAVLLLVGSSDVANHIAWGLYHYHDQPGHQQQLTQAFLLLGKGAEEVLLEMVRYRATRPELLAEVVAVLGMMTPNQEVFEHIKALGTPGVPLYQTGMTYPERQAVALRALGGLLAGGHLDSSTLQRLQENSLYGSPEHELYSILLGKPYGPLITQLENDLRTAQYEHEKDRRQFVIQLAMMKHEQEQLEEEVRQLEAEKDQLEVANRRLQEKLRQESQA